MQNFYQFVDESYTAYHAAKNIGKILEKKGFKEGLNNGSKFYITFDGAVAAFIKPKKIKRLKMFHAHTDSPALKLKPNAEFHLENMSMLAVEVYGAPLLSSWTNRDLKIAGRDGDGKLIALKELATLPQLAIHLDRDVNEKGLVLNLQSHLNLLTGIKSLPKGPYDLFAVSNEKVEVLGQDLVQGPRLDNLASCYQILEALETSSDSLITAFFFNHEEIGSSSHQGAESARFAHILERVVGDRKEYLELLENAVAISIDVAHAVHPNYPEKHDPRHPVFLGKGIAVKWSAKQKYATDATGAKYFKNYQNYVSRNDIPSGSTVGPIQSTLLGVKTIDIGIPILSMHSIREIISLKDHLAMIDALKKIIKL